MRRLTVLSVAFPFAAVGPDAVGGAEQVLSMIDEALVQAGHRSIVLACEGSRCAGELAPLPRVVGTVDAAARRRMYPLLARTLDRLVRERAADLVHMHGVDFGEYLPAPGVPTLATLHLPLAVYPRHALLPSRPGTWLHGVSASQMKTAPAGMPRLADVPNGVSLDRYTPQQGVRRRYAVAIGRICPEKGFDAALDAAARARVPLLLAGRTYAYAEHEHHFREAIAPRLREGRRFVGAVGPVRKRVLLGRARCLLVPSRIAETSSLVAMEALACGTPVIAFPAGALPDVIDHGRTGFLVDGVEAMARAIRDAGALDPRECRRAAEERFSSATMTARYLELYARLTTAPSNEAVAWSG